MKKYLYLALVSLFGLGSDVLAEGPVCAKTSIGDDVQQSVKWYTTSAEKKAAYAQVYGSGFRYVDYWIAKNRPDNGTWGVVLDIDGTTLDNSWYVQQCGNLPADNSKQFSQYVVMPQQAVAVPGVARLTCHVQDKGGYVSLVSNRNASYRQGKTNVIDATIANLQSEGICFDQVVFSDGVTVTHDKNTRFNAISTGNYDGISSLNPLPAHEVIAYFGDDIEDFPKYKQVTMKNVSGNDSEYNSFGSGYFMLPNPTSNGSWTSNEVSQSMNSTPEE